jgi:imidazolonepropionase-like amidohydrolase
MRLGLSSVAALFIAWTSAIAQGGDLVLEHARIYASPTATPIVDGTLFIRDGLIAAVGSRGSVRTPKGVATLDLQGKVVTAGFWNSHVHLMTPKLLQASSRSGAELSDELQRMLTQWGFTTVFDTASLLDNTNVIRQRVKAGEVLGPMILTVGDPFYPNGGTPFYVKRFLKDNGFPNEEITSLPDAVLRVQKQLSQGADGVKLFAGAIVGGNIGVLAMPLEQVRALAAPAHVAGKPVFSHPSNLEGLNVSIDGGVDILAHTTPMTGPWSPELTARIRAHDMALIPTLTLWEIEGKKFGEPDEYVRHDMDAALQQVSAYSKSGGQILFGTDVGYTDVFDTTEEYRLLGRVLDWRQVLEALTVAPAKRFGYTAHKGRIAKGMDADLVVLGADPGVDIAAFANISMTFRAGKAIYNAFDQLASGTH